MIFSGFTFSTPPSKKGQQVSTAANLRYFRDRFREQRAVIDAVASREL